MKATITAVTKPSVMDTLENKKELKEFIGANAGICYMSNSYFDSYVTDPEKSYKRFSTVADTGHHSIADHVYVTILFEDISKITAMILNSLGCYNTSEKSARYTNMIEKTSTKEKVLYEKWVEIFVFILTHYSYLTKVEDEKTIKKLAMENARYMISVFTPSTTMSYTASIRQWNYIIDWCDKYIMNHDNKIMEELFSLKKEILDKGIYMKELRDNKNRSFDFIVDDINIFGEDNYNFNYGVKYKASLAYLAQAQRHRTLKYYMSFIISDDINEDIFFIPPILKLVQKENIVLLDSFNLSNDNIVEEWLYDLHSVKYLIPQGLLVDIYETGTLDDFLLKCDERLCMRAQLEICDKTYEILDKYNKEFISKNEVLSNKYTPYFHKIKLHPMPKCTRVDCKENCGRMVQFYNGRLI